VIKDLLVSSLVLAGTLGLYISLQWAEEPRAVIFPKVVLMIMAILSALLLVQSLLIKKSAAQAKQRPFSFRRALLCFLMIVVYLFIMESIGFYLSSFLFFVGVTFILGRGDMGTRKALTRVGVSVIFIAVLFVLFNKLLLVQTPKGFLF
jgi:putative tricarboxylic transport membrane protein